MEDRRGDVEKDGRRDFLMMGGDSNLMAPDELKNLGMLL